MHRLIGLVALAGCADLVQTAEDFPDFGFDDTDVASCADIEGDFVAQEIAIAGVDDPQRDEDFTDFDVELGFEAPDFGSTLTPSLGDPIEDIGSFSAEDDRLLVETPLLPGFEPGLTAFACELDGDVLRLSSSLVGFDFAGDGTFEDATFEGTFTRL